MKRLWRRVASGQTWRHVNIRSASSHATFPWASDSVSLCLSIFIYALGMLTTPSLLGGCEDGVKPHTAGTSHLGNTVGAQSMIDLIISDELEILGISAKGLEDYPICRPLAGGESEACSTA